MSFHSDLIAVWPADLVSAGVVASTGQVYSGRRPRDKTDRRGEVWLERLPDPPSEGTGLQAVDVHTYSVHVLYPSNAGPDKSGKAQLDLVEAHLQTIVRRYDGEIPFSATFTGMLPAEAVEGQVDTDPEATDELEGVVNVTFRVRR